MEILWSGTHRALGEAEKPFEDVHLMGMPRNVNIMCLDVASGEDFHLWKNIM